MSVRVRPPAPKFFEFPRNSSKTSGETVSSNRRQQWFQSKTIFGFCSALVMLTCPRYLQQPISAQTGMRGQSQAADLQCISYCSSVRPGKVIIELKLRLSDHVLDRADLLSAVKRQGLEVTVYSEGFERGLYASVSPIIANARSRMRTNANQRSATAAQAKLPGLENLVITDVATRLDQQANSFVLMQTDLTPRSSGITEPESLNIRLEGAEHGVAYTFRSFGGTSVVTCHAASCPFDEVPIPKNRATRKPETKL